MIIRKPPPHHPSQISQAARSAAYHQFLLPVLFHQLSSVGVYACRAYPTEADSCIFVISDKDCFCKSKRAGTPVLCSTSQFLNGYSSQFFFKNIIFDRIAIGIQKTCQPIHHVCTEGLGSTFHVATIRRIT